MSIIKQITIKNTVLFLCLCIIVYLNSVNYLLFHSVVEIFCISIAFMVIFTIRNTQPFNRRNDGYIVIAIAYGVVGIFDLLHILSYKGMGVFLVDSSDLATQFWIVARYIECLSLLCFIEMTNRSFKVRNIALLYFVVAAFLGGTIYYDVFPTCYIEGIGLTPFKIISEYIFVFVLSVGLLSLQYNISKYNVKIFNYLKYSIVFTILSEISLIFYVDVYSISNIVGHIFKLISYYLIYKGIIQISIIRPYIQLEHNEKKYYELIQVLPEAIIIQGAQGIMLLNKAGYEVLGLSPKKSVHGIYIQECFNETKDNKFLFDNGNQKEYCITRWDGQIMELQISTIPFNFSDDESLLIIMEDISKIKGAERVRVEIEAQKMRAKEILVNDELRSSFFDNISHEFKTPLNVIMGTAQLFETEVQTYKGGDGYIPTNLSTYIKTIKQNSFRLWRLLDNLLLMTKINTGAYKLSLENRNLVEVVEDVTVSAAKYLKNSEVDIVFDTDIEERVIACDRDLIETTMLNLISNGIKFSKGEGVIFVRLVDGKEFITIEVKDEGIGIPREQTYNIFQPFAKVDDSLSRDNEGSGIGLSLVHELVKIHYGMITVESTENVETTFTIKIPTQLTLDHCNIRLNEIANKRVIGRQVRKDRLSIEFSDIYSLKEENQM